METGTLIKKVDLWSDNLKLKVEVFVDALISKTKSIRKTTSATSNRGYGSLKGQIWMSEDFNEPLEDFKDYM